MCNLVTHLDYATYSIWPEFTTSAETMDKTDTWANYEVRVAGYEHYHSGQICMPSQWERYDTGFYYYPGACATE